MRESNGHNDSYDKLPHIVVVYFISFPFRATGEASCDRSIAVACSRVREYRYSSLLPVPPWCINYI